MYPYCFDWGGLPIEQLVAECDNIYDKLSRAEKHCSEIDHILSNQASFQFAEWQSALHIHTRILGEYRNYLLASRHPAATPALRQLARSKDVPGRLCRGISTFHDLLRRHLPASRECIKAFVYHLGNAMKTLCADFPSFQDIWLECLSRISRYTWTDTALEAWRTSAHSCSLIAADEHPKMGKFYLNLAITSRNRLQQLFYCCKSPSAVVPAPRSKIQEFILPFFDTILSTRTGLSQSSQHSLDISLLKAYGILFAGKEKESFAPDNLFSKKS
jgi:hypothetical protein